MSAGSRIITLRPGNDRLSAILAAIEKANLTRKEEPYTLTSWIISCIDERLDKPRRNARAAAKRRKTLETITREISILNHEET